MVTFCNSHFLIQKGVRGVYKVVIDDTWFYIGSSVDLKRRLSAWKHVLSGKEKGGYKKNRSIMFLLPSIKKVRFDILEKVRNGVDPKEKEDVWIKKNFDNEWCLNLIPDAIGGKGRKLPLGVVRREKKKRGPITAKKPVAEFDAKGNFIVIHESIAAATRATGIKEDLISKIFSGKQKKQPRGTYFKPVDAFGKIIEVEYKNSVTPEKIKFIIDNYAKMGLAAICRELNLGKTVVSGVAFNRMRKGYKREAVYTPKPCAEKKPVAKYDLSGNLLASYESIGDAARSINVRSSAVQSVLRGSDGRKQCKGYVFKFIEIST